MFGWLRNWISRRRRNIFHYWDGSRSRSVDPAVAWRAMWEHPECNPQRDFGPATGFGLDGSRVTFEPAAQDRVLKMARDMFHLTAWTDESPGLTVDETFAVLWAFLTYMDGLKKKLGPLPTMSRPTDSNSSPAENSTIPSESDSPSTENASKSAAPSSSSKRSYQL